MNESIEQEIQAKGNTKPRVTPQIIDEAIACQYTFTADAATKGCPQHESLQLLTIAVLVLKNGFTVVGHSACASTENFDAEIGARVAVANAKAQIWALEGYLLKQALHEDSQ